MKTQGREFTGMYLNFRLGGSSGAATASSLEELSLSLLLVWVWDKGVHLKRRRWEPLLPLEVPLIVV